MSEKNREKLHLIYGIVLSALIVALGICLILSCITIYKSGDRPFTPESISTQFKKIAWLSLLCDFAVLGGIVLSLALPLEDKKLRPEPDKKATARKLRTKLASCGDGSYAAEKIAGRREFLGIMRIIVCVFAMSPVLIYLLDFSNFTSDINGSVMGLTIVLLPCATFAFAVMLAYSFYEEYSCKKEISELKKVLAECGKAESVAKPISEESTPGVTKALVVRLVIFAVAVAFIVLGIMNGGMSDVLEKAIKICTECIGLG